MLAKRRFTVLDEILEGGEGAPAHSIGLVSDDRLEQPPDEAALQDHLCSAREQGPISFWVNCPFVPCVRD